MATKHPTPRPPFFTAQRVCFGKHRHIVCFDVSRILQKMSQIFDRFHVMPRRIPSFPDSFHSWQFPVIYWIRNNCPIFFTRWFKPWPFHPLVGGHPQPLTKGHFLLTIPKKVTFSQNYLAKMSRNLQVDMENLPLKYKGFTYIPISGGFRRISEPSTSTVYLFLPFFCENVHHFHNIHHLPGVAGSPSLTCGFLFGIATLTIPASS